MINTKQIYFWKNRVKTCCYCGLYNNRVNKRNEHLKKLSHFVESSFCKEKENIINKAELHINETENEDPKQFFAEYYAEKFDNVDKEFTRIQRYSLFVLLMSRLEGDLLAFCRVTDKFLDLDSQERFAEERGIIKKTFKHIKHYTNINIEEIENDKLLSLHLSKIRNCIIHSGGRVARDKHKETIRKFIKTTNTMELDRFGNLELTSDCIEEFANKMHAYIMRLGDLISDKIF